MSNSSQALYTLLLLHREPPESSKESPAHHCPFLFSLRAMKNQEQQPFPFSQGITPKEKIRPAHYKFSLKKKI